MAISLSGTSRGANLILLGAFVEATQIIPPELIKQRIKETFTGNDKLQKSNVEAFEKGRSLIRSINA